MTGTAVEPRYLARVKGGPPEVDANALLTRYVPSRWSPFWETTGRHLLREWILQTDIATMPTFLATQQALSRQLFWAHELGLELTPEVLLSERHINAFVATGLGSVSDSTRKAYRTGLRRVARGTLRKVPQDRKHPTWNHRSIAPPYTQDELAGIDAAVTLQTTQLRTRFFDAWVCLCAGAGLRNTELRYIAAADVTDDDGVLLVHVRPPRERIVPLRREYSNRVRALMAAHPDQPLAGPFRPQQRDPLLRARSRLQIPEAVANPHTERFRSTWLIRLLNDGFPLNRILEYGGQATYRFDNTIPYLDERKDLARADLRRAAGYDT
ncbi:hypothetical protein NS263_04025 [Curtobacterium oceanosedimentum]|uniref:Tyr recombinase domain-containing protein n=1 Tax=Curtobacterium oceanosedimentum TaxID=465820 RepID=A0ABR5S9J0_9MICO|nr:tyrosine-type recombinase/integrase [Curtobacterium oceanosedimentum]KTR41652.1 hypothetical protein NS263_04025 [Curtobacterium oceanosedimentum]